MTLDDFLKYVLPDVPGCPAIVARQAVTDSADDFLTFSGVWSEVQDAFALADGVNEYDLEAPAGARCIDVRAVYTSVGALTPVTVDELARRLPNWQSATGSCPSYYTRGFDFTTLRVYPRPENPNGETIAVHAVYTLKDSTSSIPDIIVQRYRDVIADGAKAKLKSMSKVAWADLARAAVHKEDFEAGKVTARITALHGNTAGSITVPSRRFGF